MHKWNITSAEKVLRHSHGRVSNRLDFLEQFWGSLLLLPMLSVCFPINLKGIGSTDPNKIAITI